MARRTAWLHVGLPGTGAPAVAATLAAHAEAVAEQGFSLPARSEEELLRAALEVRREHKAWGYRRAEVEGTWAAVCRRAHQGRRAPLVVGDLLGAATSEQAALLLDGLAPMRTEVVLTLRDPARQALDAWAEAVRTGRATTFERYAARLLDPERGHPQAQRFWAAQHVGEVLARWSAAVGRERVHLVVLPTAGDGLEAAWRGLGAVTGLDVDALPLPRHRAGPAALDPAGVAVLRGVNKAVDGRVDKAARRRDLAPWLAAHALGGRAVPEPEDEVDDVDDVDEHPPSPAAGPTGPRLPDELHTTLRSLAEEWHAGITRAGYAVHGDLDDLLPAPPDPSRPLPDDVPLEARLETTTQALADVLVEVARLRRHNALLEERSARPRPGRRRLRRLPEVAAADGPAHPGAREA